MHTTAVLTLLSTTTTALTLPSWFSLGGSPRANPEGHGIPRPAGANHFPVVGGNNSSAPYPTASGVGAASTLSVPSGRPTVAPTAVPTAAHTDAPTVALTTVPTEAPTAAPGGHSSPYGHGPPSAHGPPGSHGSPPAGHGPPGGMHGHTGQDGGHPSYGSQGPPHGIQGRPFHGPPMVEKREVGSEPVIRPYQ